MFSRRRLVALAAAAIGAVALAGCGGSDEQSAPDTSTAQQPVTQAELDGVKDFLLTHTRPNPLDNYDVVFNTAGWPTAANVATVRARLTAFFNTGGGYIGAGAGGANFLNASDQLPGFTPVTSTPGGVGQSGIFHWANVGGAGSLVVGAFPSQDTLIMDPPTWFTAVPGTASIDARLLSDTTATFASGLWRLPRPASAASAPVIVHGNASFPESAARITAFAMNPLYRADPEREWPMVGTAAYWADQ